MCDNLTLVASIFVHASAFADRGKTAWDIWSVFPEITPACSALSINSCILIDEMFVKLEQYILFCYIQKYLKPARSMKHTKNYSLKEHAH